MEKGVSLIETILYLALFAIIFTSVVSFMLAVSENNRIAKARNRVESSMIFVTEHISESFDLATSIDVDETVFEDSSGVLTLVTPSGLVEYSVDSGRLMYNSGGSSTPLTIPDIVVTNCYLEQVLDKTSEVVGIRITFGIEYDDGEATEEIITSYLL